MRCSALLLVTAAACGSVDAPITTIHTVAGTTLTLDSGITELPEHASIRWELDRKPTGSEVGPIEPGLTTAFEPDVGGQYVVEAWLEDELSEQLVIAFDVIAAGGLPVAVVSAPPTVAVGATVDVDGSASRDATSFHWRIAMLPGGSATDLSSTDAATTSFVPDVAGDYLVELVVADALAASAPATATITATP